MVVSLLALVLGGPGDEVHLQARLEVLAARYEAFAHRHSDEAERARGAVVRELGHLPFRDVSRRGAGELLARIVAQDRSYRVRADAARAIGRIGTAPALKAMYLSLFGSAGRTRRYALLHTLLPEALASLEHPDDLDWISRRVLQPRAGALLRAAGPLRDEFLALTLEGVGRARARALGPDVAALARAGRSISVRLAAIRALVRLGTGDAVIARAAAAEDVALRAAAAGSSRLPLARAQALLSDRVRQVRRAAMRGAAGRPPKEAVGLLVARLRAETASSIRLELADRLQVLTGKDLGTDWELWRSWWAARGETFDGPRQREKGDRAYFFEVGLRTGRVAFLVDVSASMSRQDARGVSRLQGAADELAETLEKLEPGTLFSIHGFAAEIRRFPKDGPAGRNKAKLAVAWLRSLKPAGATNTYGALMVALLDPFRPDTIVLLSDGNPYRCSYRGKTYSEHEQILAEVRRLNPEQQVKIHTVALLSGAVEGHEDFDDASASDFLRRLAAQNRGEFHEIR